MTVCSRETKFTHVFTSLQEGVTGPLYQVEGQARILLGVHCGVQKQIGLDGPRVGMMRFMT